MRRARYNGVMAKTDVGSFYDQLAPFYHLIYHDWEEAIERQAEAVHRVIEEIFGGGVKTILDVACGIGTQALGLAQLGYEVTASDLSAGEVARARAEAEARSLPVSFAVADMRQAYAHHQRQFDLVIACDNAIPHLLSDEDILLALRQLYACVRPGGHCLLTVRDYAHDPRSGLQLKPYDARAVGESRFIAFQVWEFISPTIYEISFYIVEDRGEAGCQTQVMRSHYYAIPIDRLLALMEEAGWSDARRLDGYFYQPVLVGTRPLP